MNSAQICDLLRGIIWAICLTVLSSLDPSIMYLYNFLLLSFVCVYLFRDTNFTISRYHFIRGQATIKLYVIFNVLEVCIHYPVISNNVLYINYFTDI